VILTTEEQQPLTDQEQRNLKLIMILMMNVSLMQNLAEGMASGDKPRIAWTMAEFATALTNQYGTDAEKLAEDIREMSADLGFKMQLFQSGSEQVH
jgi:hypothetical protein